MCITRYFPIPIKYPFLKISFNVHSNTFQVISGWCLLVTEDIMITLFCRLTEISNHRHNHIISRPVALFWPLVNQFYSLNYLLYVKHLTRELQLPIRNLRLDSVGNRTRDHPDTERLLYHESTGTLRSPHTQP